MTRYSIQPRDPIFVKGYEFLSIAKKMGKNIGKNISKNWRGKYSQKLDDAKQSATDAFTTASKIAIQKTAEVVIWWAIKLLIKLWGFQKIHNKIIQRQFKMSMIKKCLKKDIYLQKKDK